MSGVIDPVARRKPGPFLPVALAQGRRKPKLDPGFRRDDGSKFGVAATKPGEAISATNTRWSAKPAAISSPGRNT
jgi:hypothetical protein